MAQSRINEAEEESKFESQQSQPRETGDDSESRQEAKERDLQSEDITSNSDEEEEDEDILIKPEDLIVRTQNHLSHFSHKQDPCSWET